MNRLSKSLVQDRSRDIRRVELEIVLLVGLQWFCLVSFLPRMMYWLVKPNVCKPNRRSYIATRSSGGIYRHFDAEALNDGPGERTTYTATLVVGGLFSAPFRITFRASPRQYSPKTHRDWPLPYFTRPLPSPHSTALHQPTSILSLLSVSPRSLFSPSIAAPLYIYASISYPSLPLSRRLPCPLWVTTARHKQREPELPCCPSGLL